MTRKLKNRYRLTVGGLKVELSLWTGFTDTASDLEIAKAILHHMRFYSVYEAVSNGAEFDLKMIRASKSKSAIVSDSKQEG